MIIFDPSGAWARMTSASGTTTTFLKWFFSSDCFSFCCVSREKNRFKNVVVIPEADVIRAQAPDGSKIIIEITHDHVTGVVVGSGSTADQRTMQSPRSGDGFE